MKWYVVPCMLFFSFECFSSDLSFNEVFQRYKATADSLLTGYFGEGYVREHFGVDSTHSCLYDGQRPVHFNDEQALAPANPSGLVSYLFYPDKKYGAHLVAIYVDTNSAAKWVSDTLLLDFLYQKRNGMAVTDAAIESLVSKKLRLGPGEFDIAFSFGLLLFYEMIKNEGALSYTYEYENRDRLLMRIHKPDHRKTLGSHTYKITWGRYVILDVLTGEVFRTGHTQSSETGF